MDNHKGGEIYASLGCYIPPDNHANNNLGGQINGDVTNNGNMGGGNVTIENEKEPP